MAYTFKKLSEVETLSEKPEDCNVLVENESTIKRVPASKFGGDEQADLVLYLLTNPGSSTIEAFDVIVRSGTAAAVGEKIINGIRPIVNIRFDYYSSTCPNGNESLIGVVPATHVGYSPNASGEDVGSDNIILVYWTVPTDVTSLGVPKHCFARVSTTTNTVILAAAGSGCN